MGAIFDPSELHQVCRAAVATGGGTEAVIHEVVRDLESRYPGHVRAPEKWVLNNAGGAMGAMCVLHASLTEYIVIFGTPIGTAGHSGRFLAEEWFFILDGEQWAFSPGALEAEVYRAGDLHRLRKGAAKAYRFPDKCWGLEYVRGNVPSMLPFGLADAFSSTLDLKSVWETLGVYTRATTRELMQGKI